MLALKEIINRFPLTDFYLKSRIQRLNNFSSEACYIKRDDELSFGISGSKLRKYSSLLPFLKEKKFHRIILTGNIYSNHVLGFSQLAIEHQLPFIAYLKGDSAQLKGNAFYAHQLLTPQQIHWVGKNDDPYQKALKEYECDATVFVLPEGGSCFASLPGALTLALDILENEQKHSLFFNDIFVDAGTGLTAIGLILGLSLAKHGGTIHVLLLADEREVFLYKLSQYQVMLEKEIGQTFIISSKILLDKPSTAKSFGSVNRSILQEIQKMAQEEGVLCDPIYSGKLFHYARRKMAELPKDDPKLIIHSGGALSLSGFATF